MYKNISKRASNEEMVKQVISTAWKTNSGFFENFFRILPYLLSLFGGFTLWKVIFASIGTHALGLSLMDIGRNLDEALGTGPGQSFDINTIESKIAQKFDEWLSEAQKKAGSKPKIIKSAGLGGLASGLLRSGKAGTKIAGGIVKLISSMLALFGLLTVDDFIRKMTEGVRENVGVKSVSDLFKDPLQFKEDRQPTNQPITQISPSDAIKNILPEPKNKLEQTIKSLKQKYNLSGE